MYHPSHKKQDVSQFHLRKKVDQELERLRKADLIEDVTDEQTRQWTSPVVVLSKKDDKYNCVQRR